MDDPHTSPRIALFLPDLKIGGVETVFRHLAMGFLQAGLEVDLVVGTAADAQFVPEGARLVDLGASRVATAPLPLARYLRRERPHALIAAKDHANIAAIVGGHLSRMKLPIIVTVHGRPSGALSQPERWTGNIVRLLIRTVYLRAAKVVAVSRGVADDLRSVVPGLDNRLCIIENPVISGSLSESALANLDNPWLVDGHVVPVIIWCGRLSPEKDPMTALEAFSILRKTKEARLVFLGDGPLRAELRERAIALQLASCIALPGAVPSPAPWMGRADLFVLSSRREGLPTALIEALALGTRVVSSDCDSGPRDILHDGRYGRLVPVADPGALARAIEQSLNEPTPIVPEAILHRFTVAAATSRYVEVLKELGAIPAVR